MGSFSERLGFKDFAAKIQRDDINIELRTALWNVFHEHLHKFRSSASSYLNSYTFAPLIRHIWTEIFSRPVDDINSYSSVAIDAFKIDFLTKAKWHNVYDMVEAHVVHGGDFSRAELTGNYNRVLEKHGSAYRFIQGRLGEITSKEEIDAVDEGLNSAREFAGTKTHLETAIQLLSDRENPDYRNSIKESISAVESACRSIVNDPKVTLGRALKQIGGSIKFHPALEGAFSKLYGYSSDAGGIRHSIVDTTEEVDYYEAKFILVTCGAFINYLKGKQSNKRMERTAVGDRAS